MSTRTVTATCSNITDASFRAWSVEIHNTLISFGWVQSVAAGTQMDFTTVTKPAGLNLDSGYTVYYANDALAATAPIYLKITWGMGNVSNIPGITIKVSFGPGAGVLTTGELTGTTTSFVRSYPNVTAGFAGLMRFAGNAGSFRFVWNALATNYLMFAIERDQSISGADTGLGVNVVIGGAGNYSQFIEYTGGLGAVEPFIYAMVSAQVSQAAGGLVGAGPVRCVCGVFRNPMKTVLIITKGDFGPVVTYPGVIYGVERNYLLLSECNGFNPNGWNSSCGYGILWE